jgi:CheY-like chemotaxis protein
MVIDDDRLFGKAVERILSGEHHVVRLDSAAAALTRLRGGARFDVILCDLMMPDMTGMEFYTALSAVDPLQAGRIVFLTGGACTAGVRRFLEQVPNPHVEKPLDLGRLRSLVTERLPAAVRPTSSLR